MVADYEAAAQRAFQSDTLANALVIERTIAESLVDIVQPAGRLGKSGQEPANFEEVDRPEGSYRCW